MEQNEKLAGARADYLTAFDVLTERARKRRGISTHEEVEHLERLRAAYFAAGGTAADLRRGAR